MPTAKAYFKGIGLLAGMIFGAGVFALPFAVVKSGLFWGILHFLIAFPIMIFLHLWYGEVAYFGGKNKRFTGYAEELLGKKAKWLAFLLTIFTDYGALLVYGLLGGLFLGNFFHISPVILSLLVFAAGSILIFFHFEKVASVNFYLTVLLFAMVAAFSIIALPHFKITNFLFDGFGSFSSFSWFVPYGIWLFALAGISAVPEVRDMLSGSSLKNLKKVIFASISLCAIFYLLFIFTIVGLSGGATTEDALTGAVKILGEPALVVGSILGFLAIFTSFIALGADLKNIFHYDFKLPKWLAWLCVSIPPVILFILGADNFIIILGLTGSIGLGLTGTLVVLMVRKLRKQRGENGKFFGLSFIVTVLMIAGAIAALISELRVIL